MTTVKASQFGSQIGDQRVKSGVKEPKCESNQELESQGGGQIRVKESNRDYFKVLNLIIKVFIPHLIISALSEVEVTSA